jgi:hypothetical protein
MAYRFYTIAIITINHSVTMARRTKTLGFSVPFKIAEEFEDLCNKENRSKSDMFRELFQAYKYYILGQQTKQSAHEAIPDGHEEQCKK